MANAIPRTVEIIKDTSKLEFVKKSGTQDVYNCPWCAEKYKPNVKNFYPKLYIDPDKGVGICYRCNTVVIVGDRDDPARKLHKLAVDESVLREVPLPEIYPVSKTVDTLYKRSPYLQEMNLSQLMIGETIVGGKTITIFPFIVDNTPYSYQLWLNKPDLKYYTYPAPKIPYSPVGIDTGKNYKIITLVEGVFDALGAMYMKYPNPLAILGNTLGKQELPLLRNLQFEKACVYLDETSLSYPLAVELATELGVEIEVIDPKGQDPDERATTLYNSLKARGVSNVSQYIRSKCE